MNYIKILTLTTVGLLGLLFLVATCDAQQPKFYIWADTANVAQEPDNIDIFTTWVFARTSETAHPSSGILVNFDCANNLVRRRLHVVYKQTSAGIEGPIVEDDSGWVSPSVRGLLELVCLVGRRHQMEG